MPVNYLDLGEFVDLGFLQEVNRQFFHPLGLALEVTIEDDGRTWLSGIWDYRDDPEGIRFGPNMLDQAKADLVEKLRQSKISARKNLQGSAVQPI